MILIMRLMITKVIAQSSVANGDRYTPCLSFVRSPLAMLLLLLNEKNLLDRSFERYKKLDSRFVYEVRRPPPACRKVRNIHEPS